MDLDKFANIVETMILHQDYPGFEPRSLKLGLPEQALKAPTKMFVSALGHSSVYVKLAALRWFQEHSGIARAHVNAITGLLKDKDDWVKSESLKALEHINVPTDDLANHLIVTVIPLLQDDNTEVRKSAIKTLGKTAAKLKTDKTMVVESLQKVATDQDNSVRWKAQKALRLLGYYTTAK